jgi:hypothetical protein
VSDDVREYSVPTDTKKQQEDLTAGHGEISGDEVDNEVDEDDAMEDEELAAGEVYDQDEVSDDDEQIESNEDTMEDDIAEEQDVDVDGSDEDVIEDDIADEEDADVDVSDAETPSAQDAHDSGVEDSPQVKFEGYILSESPLKTIKKSIASKQDKELHHKAWKLQPHHLPAHRYWIAILMHTVQTQKAKVEKDFIWLKGSKVCEAPRRVICFTS